MLKEVAAQERQRVRAKMTGADSRENGSKRTRSKEDMSMGKVERIDLNEIARGLGASDLAEVSDFIGYLRAKRERELPPVLRNAPFTDEPLTDGEREAIAEAEAEQGSIPWEQVKAEAGL